MKKSLMFLAVVALMLGVTATAEAAIWVPFEFTGADLWRSSPHWSETGSNPTDEGASTKLIRAGTTTCGRVQASIQRGRHMATN